LSSTIIAIDAMGGDHGPSVTIPACLQVLGQHPAVQLILVGDTAVLQPILIAHSANKQPRLTLCHASQCVAMDELPSHALRNKKDSSMRVAMNLVKEGKAHACVSAGNTGALMAIARYVLKTLPGIDRPAIISTFPTVTGKHVRMLDLGANVDSSAEDLFQFAVMGAVLVSAVDNIPHPKVCLLNIGEEEMKGNEQVKQTAQLLTNFKAINYTGYIEADAIYRGDADVIVCDGFVGNVALKATEGVAVLIKKLLKEAFSKNLLTRLLAWIASPVLKSLGKRIDPANYNGATLLGLQGIVIKSHGSARVHAFAHAVEEAVVEAEKNIPQRIRDEVEQWLKPSSREIL